MSENFVRNKLEPAFFSQKNLRLRFQRVKAADKSVACGLGCILFKKKGHEDSYLGFLTQAECQSCHPSLME